MGARPGSQEDVEVERQRRHADGPAGGVRVRRRALLGGARWARCGYGLRRRPDEDRAAACDQAAQRLEVRARQRRRDRRREASARSGNADRARRPGRSRHRIARGIRIRPGSRSHRGVLLELLRQLSGARQGAAIRRPRRRGGAVGQSRDAGGAVGDAAPLRAVPAVCLRGSVVVVARGLGPPRPVAGVERAGLAVPGGSRRRFVSSRGDRRRRRSPASEVRGEAAAQGGHYARGGSRHGRAARAAGAVPTGPLFGGEHRKRSCSNPARRLA